MKLTKMNSKVLNQLNGHIFDLTKMQPLKKPAQGNQPKYQGSTWPVPWYRLVPIKISRSLVQGTEEISEVGYRWVPATSKKKFFGYRWVPGTGQIKNVCTHGYRVLVRKVSLGIDGYRVPTIFQFMPTPAQ